MSIRNRIWSFCLCLCILQVVAGYGLSKADDRTVVNCSIQQGPCHTLLNGRRIGFDVLPKPVKAMTELNFIVTVDGAGGGADAHIELNMLAMDMGRNHVLLKKNDRGAFVGKGVIVRCRSGIRTWRAKIVISGVGTTEFIFDVIY